MAKLEKKASPTNISSGPPPPAPTVVYGAEPWGPPHSPQAFGLVDWDVRGRWCWFQYYYAVCKLGDTLLEMRDGDHAFLGLGFDMQMLEKVTDLTCMRLYMTGYDGSSKQKRPGFYRHDPNVLKGRCKTDASVPGQLHSETMKIEINRNQTSRDCTVHRYKIWMQWYVLSCKCVSNPEFILCFWPLRRHHWESKSTYTITVPKSGSPAWLSARTLLATSWKSVQYFLNDGIRNWVKSSGWLQLPNVYPVSSIALKGIMCPQLPRHAICHPATTCCSSSRERRFSLLTSATWPCNSWQDRQCWSPFVLVVLKRIRPKLES